MSARSIGGPGLAVAAALAGGLAAVVAAMGLSALARPVHRAERLAQLDQKVERIAQLQRATAGGLTYPRGAVCREGIARGSDLVAQKLRAGLGQAQMVRLAFEPSVSVDGSGLVVIGFRFETLGSYEDAMGLLRGLDAAKPAIFADSVDLTSRTSAVSLRFSGRFYCSTSARL
ncbi:hypothetical protein [Caulobacter sp. LARHSG274]